MRRSPFLKRYDKNKRWKGEIMKLPDAKYIREITEKLKAQGDITEDEADKIHLLFSKSCVNTKLNSRSDKFNPELTESFLYLLETAIELVSRKCYGVYISSFSMAPYIFNSDLKEPVIRFFNLLPARDKIAEFNISSSLKKKLPESTVNALNNWGEKVFVKSHTNFIYGTLRPGIFRTRGLDVIFKLCADLSPLVIYPFLHNNNERNFYFRNGSKFYFEISNVIPVPRIMSDVIVSYVRKNDIPHMVFGTLSLIPDEDEPQIVFYKKGIMADARVVGKIKDTARAAQAKITAVLEDSNLIWKLHDNPVSKYQECEYSDFDRVISLAYRLFCDFLKHDRATDHAKEETEEIWMNR
jgi:hypothetical protein